MRNVLSSLAITLALLTAAPAAMADDIVGVSGECYSEGYEEGGHAHVAVTDDGEVSQDGLVDTNDPTNLEGGAVAAAATFAQGMPGFMTGDTEAACTGPDPGEGDPPREGDDYLEVHVLGFQVCYDKEVHVATSEDDWACGTRPYGPPA